MNLANYERREKFVVRYEEEMRQVGRVLTGCCNEG